MRTMRASIPLFVAIALAAAAPAARAQVVVGVRIVEPPPPLPVYVQPVIPGPDYIWMPGYWAWGPDGYYWVPGTWVLAPAPGLLWTPGYWAWRDNIYVWNAGYWGPRVGFYGGICYGYGYSGVGYHGGYWRSGVFVHNTAVTNVGSVHITEVYHQTVINSTTVTNVSFNGGNGGVAARPTPGELAAAHDHHIPPTDLQMHHQDAAGHNRALFASVNGGHPAIAGTSAAGHFTGHGVVAATGAHPWTGVHTPTAGGPPGAKGAKFAGPPGGKPTHAMYARRPPPHGRKPEHH